ncbi:MAG TPA: ATP-binding protein, partial [Thermoplasmatales archaeon]|nr:ATP-binding protein [Thermoplasmatales archaeon]
MEQPAGLIYGDVGSNRFSFIVEDPTLQKFDYIAVTHREGYVLAQVTDIKRYSDLSYESIKALYGKDQTPKAIESDLSAKAEVIGYRDSRGLLQSPKIPFDVGQPVYKADEKLIRHVLGLYADEKAGAYVGLLKGHNIPVYLSIDALVQKHVCILAKTGGGKSYACGVLIEELLKKKVPVVIIDTHGEYTSLAEPNRNKKDLSQMKRFNVSPRGYASQIVEYTPLPKRGKAIHLTLNGTNLEAREILDLLSSKLTGPQIGVLYKAIKEIKEFKEVYTLRDIIERVNQSKSNAKWNVITVLEALDSTGILSEKGISPQQMVKKGRCSIINLKGVPPDIQEIVVARLTKELFDARKAGEIPPFMYIVEEAHNYCPERGFGNAVSSPILRTVASEGRKFGMGLCVVSQRPAKVDKNVISQCNTHIILKVTNPNDLRAIIQSVEGLTSDTADEIQRLQIGVALIAGGTLTRPIMTEIRTRETSHGGRSVAIISGEDGFIDYKPPKPKGQELVKVSAESLGKQEKIKEKRGPKKAELVHRVANRLGW